MKVYIAGKITGDPDYWEKFLWAQEDLERQGFTVLNPADLPEGMRPADYMRICLSMMESADVVAFLPDYTESRGAQLEWAWCQYVGKTTMYLSVMSFYRPYPKDCHESEHDAKERAISWIEKELDYINQLTDVSEEKSDELRGVSEILEVCLEAVKKYDK